jgi:UDP-glucose 4-epimerase
MIFAAVREAKRGETFVPRAPSATVVNLAKALIGDRPVKTVVTGIRPGEKIHEIMISEEEAYRTEERGKFYAILPMLPEVLEEREWRPALTKEYSSSDCVMTFEETRELLRARNLLLDYDPQDDPAKHQMDGAFTGELLR